MSKKVKVIEQIRNGRICTGCGTCAGVCPTGAIEMRVSEGLCVPDTKEEKCVDCGLCVGSCPGHSVDFENLNLKVFGKPPEDDLLGNYLRCYVGHSNDVNIRYNAASGGIASQLLISALEMGLVDGAVVVRMKRENPLETEAVVARTKQEILDASKSKYCPAASNKVLKQIIKEKGKFAIVGLPCHIHGIRKAEEICETLRGRIVLRIGLMCSHIVSFTGTEFILEKLGVDRKQVKALSYRGNGWPGGMSVRMNDGTNITIPLLGAWHSYWVVFSSHFFTPMRCEMCPDESAEFADISLGDAWLPELRHDKIGESIIVTRTKIAEDLLSSVAAAGLVTIVGVSPAKVKQTQGLNLKFKKSFFGKRLFMLKRLGCLTPEFGIPIDRIWSPVDFSRAFYPYLNIKLSSNKHVKSLLIHVPFPLFRLYFGIFKYLSFI